MTPPNLAQQERKALCDLFVERGPGAPTLCEGWSTADLAAHLVVRERRPDSGPGLVWPPLAGYTDKVRQAVRDRTAWEKLVETVRRGPPLLLRPFDGPMNTVEFFVHVEDVRRAQAGWEPRQISPELADALWARVGPGGMAKKIPATIVITSAGRVDKERGTGPRLTLAGDPGELIMFGAGRQGAARVEISGDAALASQLRAASLGV
ncbi:MAG TPA: TIGR03085 family metal-binding protein [Acidimicrobiales bacterium]|nr:TIGR03085 family metal-binding protein [Acidimicrobiales bacterium]